MWGWKIDAHLEYVYEAHNIYSDASGLSWKRSCHGMGIGMLLMVHYRCYTMLDVNRMVLVMTISQPTQ